MAEPDPAEEGRVHGGRLRVRPDVHDPLVDREGAEGDDEEREADPSDQHAVDSGTDRARDEHRDHDREPHRDAGVVEQLRQDDPREREKRAD